MSHKMVFFVVTINSQSSVGGDGGDGGGWADVAETETLADYRLEDIRVSRGEVDSLHPQLCQSLQCLQSPALPFVMSCLCLFVYSVRQRWTLCTGTWRAAARPRLPCGPLRRGTATSWRTTCGGCPSGPASTFSSCWPLPSLKSTHCDACLMTKSGFARSTNKIFSSQQRRCRTLMCLH